MSTFFVKFVIVFVNFVFVNFRVEYVNIFRLFAMFVLLGQIISALCQRCIGMCQCLFWNVSVRFWLCAGFCECHSSNFDCPKFCRMFTSSVCINVL